MGGLGLIERDAQVVNTLFDAVVRTGVVVDEWDNLSRVALDHLGTATTLVTRPSDYDTDEEEIL